MMSEISKTDAVSQSSWQDERQNFSESGKRNLYAETEKAVASKKRSGGDIASILGISPSAINSEIQEAVSALLDQLDFLRKQTQNAVARTSFLEKEVDKDCLLPIMNHRAFMREFARRIDHSKRVGFKCSFCLLLWEDFVFYRKNVGLKMTTEIFSKIILELNSMIRASDIIGVIGFDTIGIVMPLLNEIDATEKTVKLIESLKRNTLTHMGKEIPINLHFVAYEVSELDSCETAIDSSDKKLIESLKIKEFKS